MYYFNLVDPKIKNVIILVWFILKYRNVFILVWLILEYKNVIILVWLIAGTASVIEPYRHILGEDITTVKCINSVKKMNKIYSLFKVYLKYSRLVANSYSCSSVSFNKISKTISS